ncbi:uncharacterized protein LOC103137757 [Poecilia formosa]|uniref:uncharacterized protein LOC103137757 n=1 Tax=Poecilia formosa TaxID=48698 RepID=UPI0004441712|nr:PREDICTED: uncharacterized protein LOC103137757 [Poecilia formosa]
MTCELIRKIRLFLIMLIVLFYSFQLSGSVSLAQREDDSTTKRGESALPWEERPEDGQRGQPYTVKHVIWTPSRNLSILSKLLEPQLDIKHPTNPHPGVRTPELDQTSDRLALISPTWTTGNVKEEGRPFAPDPEDGYQADFTGFSEIEGKVSGLSSDSSPYFSEWEAMRPVVECADDVMTLTLSGRGFIHLQVDRSRASPISIFQLPSDCGYSVKASWTDLEMMVPYDGCYIVKENGSYVLPMLWLGIPLKLSCPVMISTAIPMYTLSAPFVFCSPYGMAVKIQGQEHRLPVLDVIVDGAKDPFVSERCAFLVDSEAQELTYLISHSAPCITTDDGPQLRLTLGGLQYVLSCPVSPQLPYSPSLPQYPPQFPSDLLFPYLPVPTHPVPTTTLPPPHRAPVKEQTMQNPLYQHHLSSGFQYHQLLPVVPHILLGIPHPPQATTDRFPESMPQHVQNPPGSEKLLYSLGSYLQYFPPHFHLKDPSEHQVFQFPHHPPVFYPYLPFYYQELIAAAEDHSKSPVGPYYPQYYHQKPDHPVFTAIPVTQAPVPRPSFPPKQPLTPQHQTSSFYPPMSYYHPVFSYSALHPAATPPVDTPDSLGHPSSQSPIQTPFHFQLPPYLLPVQKEPKKPAASPHMFYQTYHPKLHPFSPHYPKIPSPPNWITPLESRVQCLKDSMAAFLPYADPESIHVRDPFMSWQSLSSVSPFCGYMLQATAGHGLILHSPLPACHSQLQTPTTISLPISYWDFFTWQNRTLDLQCPYQSPLDPPEETPWTFPTAPSATEDESGPSIATKTEVFCSFQQMKVVLPPGPISEIVLKDTNGNQMSLAEAPKECGYYASEAKDGKIHLFLQLHSHCHMSVQGKMYIISILYTTQRGKKEAKVSCPLVIPRSEHECNLHSEYRLPCGSSSISETQCLSMGCCFNKHPPACYYPMDECTIDRHMIFSVPASLTDPPLSTALLAAASNSTCRPQRVTPEYALFKIPMDGCGTRRVVVGKTVVYMVEITNTIQTVSLNYGTITRDSPVRLLVECRYVPGTVLGVSYVVKTPTLGPDVHTQGVFGVQLRIAKDAQYTSYYPQYHQPLHMLLGKPLHLEVRLLSSPDPSLVLLVHFCVAYPRSGNAAWVLLYNGCPNPLDPAPPETVLSDPTPPSPQSQTRRFTIRTFQFLPDGEFQDMDEEIYFMCSTEICSPRDGPCVEGCFGQ